jgi:aldehyde dehydrogenase (NAD+)
MTSVLNPASSTAPTTSAADTVAALRATFERGTTRPLAWRRRQLEQMVAMLEEHEEEWLAALAADLGKPRMEGFVADIAFVTGEIRLMLKNLRRWNRTERVRTPLVNRPGSSRRIPEPLGTVLVIAPWNYPVQLLLVPAAGAVAAGNTVVMKPSEVTAATSDLFVRLAPAYLDQDAIRVVPGGVPETTALLEQRFNHIFFTGSTSVGRVVMAAAAQHLTPVTLELGGKSPVIVDRSANLKVAARRIAWGKWLNAGQTCVAPDYVLVDRAVEQPLIDELRRTVAAFYGAEPKASADYGRIVSPRHFDRLVALMKDGTPVVGGESDASSRYIAPTVLTGVAPNSRIMSEEIFGPLLPVFGINGIDEAVSIIRSRPHPLALYVFAEDGRVVDDVLARTTAGGVTVNGTVLHLTNPHLPLGGVGDSGMGYYHGKESVRVFQHLKPVLRRGTRLDPPIVYPPYSERKMKLLRKAL